MGYISTAELRDYSGGNDISDLEDAIVQVIIDAASAVCDAETNTTWGYRTVFNEMHPWPSRPNAQWKLFPYHGPIRTVTGFQIATSMNINSGDFYEVNFITSPAGPSNTPPTFIKTNYGQVLVDRDTNSIDLVSSVLQYGIFGNVYPIGPLRPARALLSYTCGYDDGTIQSDTYSLPAPSWLKEATRLISSKIISELDLTAEGLGDVTEIHEGTISFRREASEKIAAFSPSDNIRRLLRHHRKTSMRG